jgi:predicted nucleotidyltransferase
VATSEQITPNSRLQMTSCNGPLRPPRAQSYIDAVLRICKEYGNACVSVILFGSVATGGFSETVSDVDLILVLRDDVEHGDRNRLCNDVTSVEVLYGFGNSAAPHHGALEAFFERVSANHRSILACTRQDLLSGNVARILNIDPVQAIFVDRIVVPSICSSSVTLWGESLVADVSTAPIRRFDVLKAFCLLFSQVMLSEVLFPLLPKATRYAMGALKASVNSCFFCYHSRRASLQEEVDFFLRRYGPSPALEQLLELRKVYSQSFGFVARCLPALAQLHPHTALDLPFHR